MAESAGKVGKSGSGKEATRHSPGASQSATPGVAHAGNQAVQRAVRQQSAAPSPAAASLVQQARGGPGLPLDSSAQAGLPRAFGDLSDVRLHTDRTADDAARSLNARAFTVGRDIFFRGNAYSPGAPESNRLIAHESAHVVQQRSAGPGENPVFQP